jgi:hypothetical protein
VKQLRFRTAQPDNSVQIQGKELMLRRYLEARASLMDEELQFIRTLFTPGVPPETVSRIRRKLARR